jgi:hypothetical protein
MPARLGISQSQALAEVRASATASQVELLTIALYHSSFKDEAGNATAIYCVNDYVPLVATIENGAEVHGGVQVTFQPIPFGFVFPEEADGAPSPEFTIEIANISREISSYLKEAAHSGECVRLTSRTYLPSDTSAPHDDPALSLILRNVTVTDKIRAKASFGDLVNARFPLQLYNRRNYPGLVAS